MKECNWKDRVCDKSPTNHIIAVTEEGVGLSEVGQREKKEVE